MLVRYIKTPEGIKYECGVQEEVDTEDEIWDTSACRAHLKPRDQWDCQGGVWSETRINLWGLPTFRNGKENRPRRRNEKQQPVCWRQTGQRGVQGAQATKRFEAEVNTSISISIKCCWEVEESEDQICVSPSGDWGTSEPDWSGWGKNSRRGRKHSGNDISITVGGSCTLKVAERPCVARKGHESRQCVLKLGVFPLSGCADGDIGLTV